MNRSKQVLCIGGKHDGRRVAVEYYSTIVNLADPIPIESTPGVEPMIPIADCRVESSVYLIERLSSGKREYYVGHPPDQTLDSTMALLIQGYRGT